eukprot:TRINITY_DN4537_c0_g2_i1.p1 TRINITY_DN4537_c0_g2~~TRINITY_DN4537_c0_g2_i1.p1  ORF type:complete len:697 (-),score=106.86 TRINITY_DN4537_c0_g2_i1:28-2076(-)
MGMLQILLGFPLTYFIYRVVLQYYWMGILNFLSLFIILGIGADDIFIFSDTWKQSHSEGSKLNKDLKAKLGWTWRRSSRTTLVTTVTTAAAFFANMISEIPPIRQFGVFTGVLVIVNYILVIIWFPSALVIHYKYLEKYFLFCITDDSVSCLPCVRSKEEMNEKKRSIEQGERNLRLLERFFKFPYTKFVDKFKIVLLLVFLILFGVTSYGASLITPDDEPAVFLPDGHNFALFGRMSSETFYTGGRTGRFALVWGISGIDRSKRNIEDISDFGKPVYDDNFIIDDSNAVQVQNFMLDACEEYFDFDGLDGEKLFNSDTTDCFMESYQSYLLSNNHTFPVQTGFVESICTWADQYGWQSDITCNSSDEDMYIVWFQIRGYSTLSRTPESKLRPIWQSLEDFVQGIKDSDDTPEVLKSSVFQTSTMYVNMETESELVRAAIYGIFFSLVFVFIVLLISTYDIVITIYAIFSIGGVVLSILSLMVLFEWKLGLIESICAAILAGLSVDYIVHLAVAYREAKVKFSKEQDKSKRYIKARMAVTELGISVLSASITTTLSSIMLFFTTLIFFVQFGQFIVMAIVSSTIWAFGFFMALLFTIGPETPYSNILFWLKGCKETPTSKLAISSPSSSTVPYQSTTYITSSSSGQKLSTTQSSESTSSEDSTSVTTTDSSYTSSVDTSESS